MFFILKKYIVLKVSDSVLNNKIKQGLVDIKYPSLIIPETLKFLIEKNHDNKLDAIKLNAFKNVFLGINKFNIDFQINLLQFKKDNNNFPALNILKKLQETAF